MADQGRWRADGEEEFAAELGYVIISASEGRSELTWEPKPPWVNRTGTVFGGIVAAMVDTVAGTAVGSSPKASPSGGATVAMHIDYLRPMALGLTYTCRGEAVRVGRRIAVADAHFYDPAGLLMVRGTVTMAMVGQ